MARGTSGRFWSPPPLGDTDGNASTGPDPRPHPARTGVDPIPVRRGVWRPGRAVQRRGLAACARRRAHLHPGRRGCHRARIGGSPDVAHRRTRPRDGIRRGRGDVAAAPRARAWDEDHASGRRPHRSGVSNRRVVHRRTGLLPAPRLAADSGVTDSGGWGGVTLAKNVRSPDEVDAVLVQAEKAGAHIAGPGGETFWGGYSGVFVDPNGHPWEVTFNPGRPHRDDGSVD